MMEIINSMFVSVFGVTVGSFEGMMILSAMSMLSAAMSVVCLFVARRCGE